MRKTLIGAAAAATVAVTGFAFAQERPSEQKPAAGQMEKAQAGERATGHEGASAQAQGQKGEQRQGQRGEMGANEGAGTGAGQREREAPTGQRQGEAGGTQKSHRQAQEGKNEAPSSQAQTGQTGQAGGRESSANQAQTEHKANASESGAPGSQKQEGQQRAGDMNKTEKGQAAQAQPGTQGAQGARNEERAGAMKPNREGAGQASQTATTRNHEGAGQAGETATTGNRGEEQNSTAKGPNAGGGAATVEARGSAHLSNQQASHIADTLWSTASPAQTSVNISVDVGAPLPGNVELMPLPPAVVSIVPEYRGYDYVVVHDEIVIVQPSTRKVVEVIHRGGGAHATREGGGHERRLTLSESQQRLIKEMVRREHIREEPVREQLSFGATVPQDITLEPVPQPLIAQIPIIEQYRMFVAGGDRIMLVDPDTREVVDVID